MPLAFFRLGLFGWSRRHSIRRGLIVIASAIMLIPVVLALLVTSAVANLPLPGAAGLAKPMASWQVSQSFGCTGFIFEPRRGDCLHFHSGIDLVGPVGGAVYAVLPGAVEVKVPSGYGGGYGIHVLVHHDAATLTMYAHLLTATVLSGQSVLAGAVIGYEGSTGLSTGPHLHFEVRRAGLPVDPAAVFPSLFGSTGRLALDPATGFASFLGLSGRTSSSMPVGVTPRPNSLQRRRTK
jgi:murein DD-endopeptidase MepM/ murein hydrolase activator NlpD